MEKIKKIYNKYKLYIFIAIIIILIIIIGFLYSYKVTLNEELIINSEIKEENNKIDEEKQETLKVDIKGEVKHPGVYELYKNDRVIDVIKKADGLTLDADTSYINLSKKIKDEMVIIVYSKDEVKEYRKKQKEVNENKKTVNKIEKYEEVKEELVCPNIVNDSCIKEEDSYSSNIKSTEKTESKKGIKDEVENIKEKEENLDSDNSSETEEILNNKININTASKEELLTLKGIGESKADKIIEYRNNELFNSIEDIKNISGIGDSIFEKIKDNITT